MVNFSVVIPLLDESSLIHELISRVKFSLSKLTDNFEIIIVDDGSTDISWEIIQDEAKLDKRIKAIKFSKNFGHHFAITAGIHESRGEWVVVMDADLQDDPDVIPVLFAEAKKGFDVVFVSRINRKESKFYRIAQKFFYWILKALSGIDFDSNQANFSIISRKVADAFKQFPETHRFYVSTIKWLGFSRSQVYAEQGKRHSGKPSYNFKKRVNLATDVILSFSERPLLMAIYIGIFIAIFSLFLTARIIYKSLTTGYSVTGWSSLIVAVLFSTSTILITLGILGIYIGRIFKEVKHRPLYVISEKIN